MIRKLRLSQKKWFSYIKKRATDKHFASLTAINYHLQNCSKLKYFPLYHSNLIAADFLKKCLFSHN